MEATWPVTLWVLMDVAALRRFSVDQAAAVWGEIPAAGCMTRSSVCRLAALKAALGFPNFTAENPSVLETS